MNDYCVPDFKSCKDTNEQDVRNKKELTLVEKVTVLSEYLTSLESNVSYLSGVLFSVGDCTSDCPDKIGGCVNDTIDICTDRAKYLCDYTRALIDRLGG